MNRREFIRALCLLPSVRSIPQFVDDEPKTDLAFYFVREGWLYTVKDASAFDVFFELTKSSFSTRGGSITRARAEHDGFIAGFYGLLDGVSFRMDYRRDYCLVESATIDRDVDLEVKCNLRYMHEAPWMTVVNEQVS